MKSKCERWCVKWGGEVGSDVTESFNVCDGQMTHVFCKSALTGS